MIYSSDGCEWFPEIDVKLMDHERKHGGGPGRPAIYVDQRAGVKEGDHIAFLGWIDVQAARHHYVG
jgi:hypothetical protein